MSNPTLFRTEAISKLSEAVKNIRSTQQTLQSSSSVRSKTYNITTAHDFWIGSVKYVQDQLGVFVILSVGNTSDKGGNGDTLQEALESILLPISLNTESEVYTLVNMSSSYRIGCDHKLELRLLRIDDSLRLSLAYDLSAVSYGLHGTCIYGLIPDATLNEELSPQH